MTVVTRTRNSVALYVRTLPMPHLMGTRDVPCVEPIQRRANDVKTVVVLVSR